MSLEQKLLIPATIVSSCKGENAWQTDAGMYRMPYTDPLALANFELIAGQAMSYNNWCDADRLLTTMTHIVAAIETATEKPNGCAVVLGAKHGNCCGAGVQEELLGAMRKMLIGDPLAIFGGTVMTNFKIDEAGADTLLRAHMKNGRRLLDCVIASEFTDKAVSMLTRKEGRCRLLANRELGRLTSQHLDAALKMRQVRGGLLVQSPYHFVLDLKADYITHTGRASEKQELDLALAWAIGSTSNSNTITLVQDRTLIANGVGQQDRVGAAKLAVERAHRSKHHITGASAYSDSFFPFPDGVEVLLNAKIGALFASSGSVNDELTVAVCKERGVPLYMAPDAMCRGFFGH